MPTVQPPLVDGMSSPLTMSEAERQAFLAETHVAVLSVPRADGRPPLSGPVWYAYEPGGDVLATIAASGEKARLLAASPTASLCAQTEQLPYKFVTVAGPVVLEPADDSLRREIAARYLAASILEDYLASSGDAAEMLTMRLTPRSWYSNDFGKLGQ